MNGERFSSGRTRTNTNAKGIQFARELALSHAALFTVLSLPKGNVERLSTIGGITYTLTLVSSLCSPSSEDINPS